MPKIDETLKNIAARMSNTGQPASPKAHADPVCPICGGSGFVSYDLPITDPNFGKAVLCVCQQKNTADAVHERLYSISNMSAFKDMTFENFSSKGRLGLSEEQVKSLTYALNQAQHYSQAMNGWLVFVGGYGCGKTHLAAAIANFALSLGAPTLFLTVPDLLDWLRFSYDNPEARFEDRFEEIRNMGLLVLDDLGTQNATPWAEEKLYQIINHRYVNHLPTIITTNQELSAIDGRVRSRLEDPSLTTIVRINAPDYRSPLRGEATQTELSSLHLHSSRTFASFSLRENSKLPREQIASLRTAFDAARKFAENPRGWLVLSGGYGTGKTHLAAAIGNYRLSSGDSPMFVVVPDLLDHLRATFSPNSQVSMDSMFDRVKNTYLLILDDLGTQSATPWAREKMYQLFNHRYAAELPTVITTSLPLKELDPRISSRMGDARLCQIVEINVDAFTGQALPKATRARPKLSNT